MVSAVFWHAVHLPLLQLCLTCRSIPLQVLVEEVIHLPYTVLILLWGHFLWYAGVHAFGRSQLMHSIRVFGIFGYSMVLGYGTKCIIYQGETAKLCSSITIVVIPCSCSWLNIHTTCMSMLVPWKPYTPKVVVYSSQAMYIVVVTSSQPCSNCQP